MNPLVFTGLGVGILFGFALQRGRFCMNSAFRDIILMQEFTLLKALGIAILIEMLGFTILEMTGFITLNPKPLVWGANIAGGLIFGIGMVVAGGCASGITYRVGEGMVGAMSAVAGFALVGLMTSGGILKPVKDYLQVSTKIMTPDGKSLTVANIFALPHYPVALGIVFTATVIWVIFAIRNKEEDDESDSSSKSLFQKIFQQGWNWLPTGIVIGFIGILAYLASTTVGRNYPLGITSGWTGIWNSLIRPDFPLSWDAMLIIGVVLGAFIASVGAKEFSLRAPEPKVMLQTFAGGGMMAFGAVTSGGCNIGHILSGVPMLSIGSIVGGMSIILGAWASAYVIFIFPNR
jgi:uncharacterized protein